MADIMGAQPVYDITGGAKTDGMLGAGGSGVWVLLLFILLLGGGAGGILGGRNTVAETVSNEFLFNNLNNAVNTGFTATNKGICDIQLQMCQGFGSVNHNIDLSTCRLETAIHAEGEATRALINANTMQDLRDRAQVAETSLSNAQQTQYLVNTLRPYPTASYLTVNPQAAYAPYPPMYFGGAGFGFDGCHRHHCDDRCGCC